MMDFPHDASVIQNFDVFPFVSLDKLLNKLELQELQMIWNAMALVWRHCIGELWKISHHLNLISLIHLSTEKPQSREKPNLLMSVHPLEQLVGETDASQPFYCDVSRRQPSVIQWVKLTDTSLLPAPSADDPTLVRASGRRVGWHDVTARKTGGCHDVDFVVAAGSWDWR